MKTKIIATVLFALTAGAIAGYPTYQAFGTVKSTPVDPVVDLPNPHPAANERRRVEVVFVLDTTGSMSGLIQTAKEKIWSIATTMSRAQPAPEIRMGLVAYRDRGDQYVTRVVDLSSDLDSVYATLMDFQAQGGGDVPESVNQALYEAVHNMSWSRNQDTYRTVFLVGDAPPHMRYRDDVKYPQTLAAAKAKGIVVNTIQCGQLADTTARWRDMARLGAGRYFQVEQSGGAVAITTPFDDKLARLSAELDETRLYYGSAVDKVRQQRKRAATEKLHAGSSAASRARRATFNASASGKANLLGEKELVEDVTSGRVDLSKMDQDNLPEPMQAMAPGEQAELIKETAERRDVLKTRIRELADKREAFLRNEVAERGGAEESLDHKLYGAIRDQAGKRGLRYGEDGPAY